MVEKSASGATEVGLPARANDLQQQLAACAAQLQACHRQQELFAYGVSHELRAPLRAIDNYAALLADHADAKLDLVGRDYLERIRVATGRMTAIIDMLLEFSRAARVELHSEPVDLSLLAEWVYAELADAEPQRNVEFQVQSGLVTQGDERQLKVLLQQLLHNAWKFSRERERTRIEVSGHVHGEHLVLSVRDQGIGFDMRYAHKLFEPFQRLHGSEQAGGSGLGLAVAQCIAQRHHGRIWAESELGRGSTFYLELPAATAEAATA